jgi:acid stress-induced BolA-like protein IbaG/YrbA
MAQQVTRAAIERLLSERLRLREPHFQFSKSGPRISGSIVSSTFRRKTDHQRQHMILQALESAFGPNVFQRVGMLFAFTPDEWEFALQDAAEARGETRPLKSRAVMRKKAG